MANPLVAQRQDSTSPLAGTFLLEDGEQLVGAFNSGSWVSGGMAAFAAVGDAASMIADPIGSLIAMGAGWVLEHVHPLDQWLDEFTGDADQVAAYAQTWGNINTQLSACSQQLAGYTRSDLSSMSGQTISAITALEADLGKLIEQAGKWASAMGQALNVAATLVQIVHDLVRDALSEIIGKFASAIIEAVATAGLGIPAIAAQISTSVATMTSRISTTVHKVIDSVKNLKGLLGKLTELFRKFSDTLNRLLRKGADTPSTRINASAPHVDPAQYTEFSLHRSDATPHWDTSPAPFGKNAHGEPYPTYDAWASKNLNSRGVPNYRFQDTNGALPDSVVRHSSLQQIKEKYGRFVDRIGHPGGQFVASAPEGRHIPFEKRSMPPPKAHDRLYGYQLGELPRGYSVEEGTIAPALGFEGGGKQFIFLNERGEMVSIAECIEKGILLEWIH